ncbi:MAG: hypothetical protein QW607_05745 [Desulfurococcaceae archaeon]
MYRPARKRRMSMYYNVLMTVLDNNQLSSKLNDLAIMIFDICKNNNYNRYQRGMAINIISEMLRRRVRELERKATEQQ